MILTDLSTTGTPATPQNDRGGRSRSGGGPTVDFGVDGDHHHDNTMTPGRCSVILCTRTLLVMLRLAIVLALIGVIAVQALAVHAVVTSGGDRLSGYDKALLVLGHAGLALLAVLMALAELGAPAIVRMGVVVLRQWALRGPIIVWIGALLIGSAEKLSRLVAATPEEGGSSGTREERPRRNSGGGGSEVETAATAIGWVLVSTGALLFLCAVLRLRRCCAAVQQGERVAVSLWPCDYCCPSSEADRQGSAPATGSGGPGGGGGLSDRQLAKLRASASFEENTLISNMAIALDLTSAQAWERFTSSNGAAQASALWLREERYRQASANLHDSIDPASLTALPPLTVTADSVPNAGPPRPGT